MSQFESSVKSIQYSQEQVYSKLADLNNLEAIKDRIPEGKVADLVFDSDTLSFSVPPVGKITIQIIEREPFKCIKFGSINSPIPFNLWIQLLPVTEIECNMKITLSAELNMFMKGMVQKPLQDGLEKMVEMLSKIPY